MTAASIVRCPELCGRGASSLTSRLPAAVRKNSTVSTPWGDSFPGVVMFGFLYDEFLHHRGQLYAYARTFGIEPRDLREALQTQRARMRAQGPRYKPLQRLRRPPVRSSASH